MLRIPSGGVHEFHLEHMEQPCDLKITTKNAASFGCGIDI